MADIVYYANEIDANGELHFKRVDTHVEFNLATLKVQAIDPNRRVIIVEHPVADPTLAEFYEPQPHDSEQGDG